MNNLMAMIVGLVCNFLDTYSKLVITKIHSLSLAIVLNHISSLTRVYCEFTDVTVHHPELDNFFSITTSLRLLPLPFLLDHYITKPLTTFPSPAVQASACRPLPRQLLHPEKDRFCRWLGREQRQLAYQYLKVCLCLFHCHSFFKISSLCKVRRSKYQC